MSTAGIHAEFLQAHACIGVPGLGKVHVCSFILPDSKGVAYQLVSASAHKKLFW